MRKTRYKVVAINIADVEIVLYSSADYGNCCEFAMKYEGEEAEIRIIPVWVK